MRTHYILICSTLVTSRDKKRLDLAHILVIVRIRECCIEDLDVIILRCIRQIRPVRGLEARRLVGQHPDLEYPVLTDKVHSLELHCDYAIGILGIADIRKL